MQRAVSAVLARVERSLAAHDMIEAGQRVLVAVSGGPDSIGLLGILAQLRRKLKITLVAGHVNHRLRGADSDADERCAAAAATQLGIEFARDVLPRDLRSAGNLEERARALRYRALHELADQSGCERVATGHTRDDQAETVLLRLLRGSAPAGLAGIQPVRDDGVIRPLLECSRAEVEHVTRVLGLSYRTDASNADPRFTRSRLRHEVFPLLRQLNPNLVENLARVAALCSAEAAVVAAWAEGQVGALLWDGGLDIEALRALPAALQGHVIRAWLVGAGVSQRGLTARHVGLVRDLARGRSPSGTVQLKGARVHRRYRLLQLGAPEKPDSYPPQALQMGEAVTLPGGWRITVSTAAPAADAGVVLPADLWTAVCDADALERPLQVRPPRVGDRVAPLGLGGTRKLSDVFTDRKVPVAERPSYPLVASAEGIVWVPGIVRSELLRVRPDTRRILSLQAWRNGVQVL